YVSDTAKVENSLITDGCEVYGNVDYSILFENVTVEEGALVEYSLVMPGAVIKKGAVVRYSIIAENTVIGENAQVGVLPETVKPDYFGISVVGDNITVGEGAIIGPRNMITENVNKGAKI
ncbi:MAG: glucose-1-phosphate adenylyltransferase, partial [Clostridia bacterium]|nr:glucose-1-phosphate adenylyltransferase [Clostridia bacterium]